MSTNNTYFTLADLKDSPVLEGTAFLVDDPSVANGMFFWTPGDFSGEADDENVIQSDDEPLSVGAWLRQSATAVAYKLESGAAIQTLASAVRVIRSVSNFAMPGDTDTQTVQRAIDQLIAMGQNATLIIDGTYTVSGLVLNNATDLIITGGHLILARQTIVTDGLRVASLFRPAGTCSNIHIKNVRMTGPDDDAEDARHSAFYQDTGPNLDFVLIEGCDIRDFNAGICFNGGVSGTVGQCIARGNRISNMVGTLGGQGYGLFANGANGVDFDGNFLDRTQRHAVYISGSGASYSAGVLVRNNQSRNHRLGVTNGDIRPAFYYARTYGIISEGNQVHDFYDGAFGVAQDSDPESGNDAGRIIMRGDVWYNRQNAVPSLIVGQQVEPGNILNGADIDVTGFTDEAVGGRTEEISVPNGLNINLNAKLHIANIGDTLGDLRPVLIGNQAPRGSRDLNNLDAHVTLYPTFTTGTAPSEGAVLSDTLVSIYRLAGDVCSSTNTSFNTGYDWVQSVADADEWYLTTTASGDPGLPMPAEVYQGTPTPATRLSRPGTLGNLVAGSWGYGDNDSLGFATIYVRTSSGGDPGTTMSADFPSQIRLSYDVRMGPTQDNAAAAPVSPISVAGARSNRRCLIRYGDALTCISNPDDGDPQPSVWGGVNTLLLNNSTATDVTMFRDFEITGHVLKLTFANGNTTLKQSAVSGTGLRLAGGTDLTPGARDMVELTYSGNYSQWLRSGGSDNA